MMHEMGEDFFGVSVNPGCNESETPQDGERALLWFALEAAKTKYDDIL